MKKRGVFKNRENEPREGRDNLMKRVRWVSCAAVLSLALVAPLAAHHSLGLYDQAKLIRIKGVITKVE